MITIVCVYKTGPKFDPKYVTKLFNRLNQVVERDFKFLCLTDSGRLLSNDNIKTEPLLFGLEGWWSKIEMFRPYLFDTDRILYFDLDTLFLGPDIEKLLNVIYRKDFMMLRALNPAMAKNDAPASGIMSWKSDCKESKIIYRQFMKNPVGNINRISQYKGAGQSGDQGFIGEVLDWSSIPKLQDYLPENYIISKRKVRRNGNYIEGFTNARIVEWSGYPVIDKLDYEWVKGIW